MFCLKKNKQNIRIVLGPTFFGPGPRLARHANLMGLSKTTVPLWHLHTDERLIRNIGTVHIDMKNKRKDCTIALLLNSCIFLHFLLI